MFSPADAPAGTGPVVLFQFDCLHPTDFTFRFTPELRWMWPERNEGVPGVEWVAPPPNAVDKAGGFYILHSDYPDLAAAITIPGARPGILAPYQERPQVYPVELKLHIDPARDHGSLYPLLMAIGTDHAAANCGQPRRRAREAERRHSGPVQAHAETYKKLLANSVSIETPDKSLNEAFQWAVISIEQLKTKTIPGQSSPPRRSLQPRKKPPSSPATTPPATPPAPASAGSSAATPSTPSTPSTATATSRSPNPNSNSSSTASAPTARSCTSTRRPPRPSTGAHSPTCTPPPTPRRSSSSPCSTTCAPAATPPSSPRIATPSRRPGPSKPATRPTPTRRNGIYDNTQGTGWVESWPGGMPHQEIYLALLDQQASAAMAQLEELLGNKDAAAAAQLRAETISKTIDAQFYDQEKGCYAFSRNPDGSLDRTTTVYPALAWWSSPSVTNNSTYLAHPEGCLQQFAAHTLNTDWGLRDVSNEEKIYDGMSYHQGSVWPLFTGWAALAEYRGNQPLAGYQMLMENANLTWAQDLGADTELLSGDFFVPFGRSTSHQLWSSAMVITPTLRGLFGLDIDAQTKTITVNPHLPANWDRAEIRNIRVGSESVGLTFLQSKGELTVSFAAPPPPGVKLASTQSGTKSLPNQSITIPRPVVAVVPFFRRPSPGDRTQSIRVLNEVYTQRQLSLTLEGPAGAQLDIPLVLSAPAPKLRVDGAELQAQPPDSEMGSPAHFPAISLQFPSGEGWKTMTVTLSW